MLTESQSGLDIQELAAILPPQAAENDFPESAD